MGYYIQHKDMDGCQGNFANCNGGFGTESSPPPPIDSPKATWIQEHLEENRDTVRDILVAPSVTWVSLLMSASTGAIMYYSVKNKHSVLGTAGTIPLVLLNGGSNVLTYLGCGFSSEPGWRKWGVCDVSSTVKLIQFLSTIVAPVTGIILGVRARKG